MGDSINEDIHIGGGETYVFRYIVDILKNLQKDYLNIHCHLYSRNSAEITELLDKGLLDFSLLMQPADLTKHSCINIQNGMHGEPLCERTAPLQKKNPSHAKT